MICPMRKNQYNAFEECVKSKCSWWTGNVHAETLKKKPDEVGMCAIMDMALSLEGIRYDAAMKEERLSRKAG